MDKQFWERWNALKPLPIGTEEYRILKVGIKTGSRMFGGATKKSDLDIFMPRRDDMCFDYFMQKGYGVYISNHQGVHYRGNSFENIYVKFAGRPHPVNLLFFTDEEEMEHYKKATRILIAWKKLLKDEPTYKEFISDKKRRVALFELLKGEEVDYDDLPF